MFDTRVHFVCEACGLPGVARLKPSGRPGDVEFPCSCGHLNVLVCAAGIGPVIRSERPDAPPIESEPRWKIARRRGIAGRSA